MAITHDTVYTIYKTCITLTAVV